MFLIGRIVFWGLGMNQLLISLRYLYEELHCLTASIYTNKWSIMINFWSWLIIWKHDLPLFYWMFIVKIYMYVKSYKSFLKNSAYSFGFCAAHPITLSFIFLHSINYHIPVGPFECYAHSHLRLMRFSIEFIWEPREPAANLCRYGQLLFFSSFQLVSVIR